MYGSETTWILTRLSAAAQSSMASMFYGVWYTRHALIHHKKNVEHSLSCKSHESAHDRLKNI
jgi:hypothetical protein